MNYRKQKPNMFDIVILKNEAVRVIENEKNLSKVRFADVLPQFDLWCSTEELEPSVGYDKAGWLAPSGEIYPCMYDVVSGEQANDLMLLHEGIAKQICKMLGVEFTLEYGGTTAQRELMHRGFIRIDFYNIDFMIRPTQEQIDALKKYISFRRKFPNESFILDEDSIKQMEKCVAWYNKKGDKDDQADFEFKLVSKRWKK
jgi:hypothetical protein